MFLKKGDIVIGVLFILTSFHLNDRLYLFSESKHLELEIKYHKGMASASSD